MGTKMEAESFYKIFIMSFLFYSGSFLILKSIDHHINEVFSFVLHSRNQSLILGISHFINQAIYQTVSRTREAWMESLKLM